jgi:hypothetical protein
MLNTADLLQKELLILQAQESMAEFLLDEECGESYDDDTLYDYHGSC